MEIDDGIDRAETTHSAERERSRIEFPYTDLENAVELVKAIHEIGGHACDFHQLAAHLLAKANGGGFRLRVNGAKTFRLITYDRGGRISLTELGCQVVDSHSERAARAKAFLEVPLYSRVFDKFKGGPLPPQAGLEQVIEDLGVGSKVKEKARQVMLRSAKQAGFFEASHDRLVKPTIRQDSSFAVERSDPVQLKAQGSPVDTVAKVVGAGSLHPLIQGLLVTLPPTGHEWAAKDRQNWLSMASSIFNMIYKDAGNDSDITKTQGGPTSSA